MINKTLVLDMDGTFVDLYGVENWLADLRSFSTRPYEIAKPLVDTDTLGLVIDNFRALGWQVEVVSWSSKESNKTYDGLVEKAKKEWLARHGLVFDKISVVPYGTPKRDCIDTSGFCFLADDSKEVIAEWETNKNCFSIGVDNLIENLLALLY